MTRWAPVDAVIERISNEPCWHPNRLADGHQALHDQESAGVREHLLSMGVDITNDDELHAVIAGVHATVAWVHAAFHVGRAGTYDVSIVNAVATELANTTAPLLATATRSREQTP